jgi:hypothetical protein
MPVAGIALPLPHQAKIVFLIYLTNDIFYSYISIYSIDNRKRDRANEFGQTEKMCECVAHHTGR